PRASRIANVQAMTASRVVYFTDSAEFGGAEQALATLIAELDRERWSPTLVHHPAPGLKPLLEQVRALDVPTWSVPAMPEGARGAARIPRFAAALRRRRPLV